MRVKTVLFLILVQAMWTGATKQVDAQSASYPSMAPLAQYLMPEKDEIALARSGAPKGVSDAAEVMVLTKDGYVAAVDGTNGFLCIVERAWANETTRPDFWNPKMRGPNCFNAAAAKTYEQLYLLKTRLVLEGKSKQEIAQAIVAARDSKELPALAPGAMCYMMSKEQYLNDVGKNWHPHLMFFVAGDVAKSWGADTPDSPLIAANNAEARVTIFMMTVGKWSDGTPDATAGQ